jgi:RNA polymerase sigma-70 factor (ECF subfamily)
LQAAVPDHAAPPGEPEIELVARAAEGDRCAFTALYDLYYDRVYRYVLYRLGRVEETEDVTQQVFVLAWRGLGSHRRAESGFAAWLFVIAHNAMVSHLRSRKPGDYRSGPLPDLPGGVDPETEVDDRFERERIRRAILRLQPDQQQVISLRFLEGFSYPEIAAALGKSEGNVRVIQHRGLGRLRQLLQAEAH